MVLAGVVVSPLARADDHPRLPDLIRAYQAEAAQIDPQEGMSENETFEWISRFEIALEENNDPRWTQAGYEVVISLWDWLEEWDHS